MVAAGEVKGGDDEVGSANNHHKYEEREVCGGGSRRTGKAPGEARVRLPHSEMLKDLLFLGSYEHRFPHACPSEVIRTLSVFYILRAYVMRPYLFWMSLFDPLLRCFCSSVVRLTNDSPPNWK